MCAFTHITLHPRIYHSHLPSSEQCRPYLRRLLLECFGDPILNLLIGREGEHQPPTSCAAHLGAEGSRGACDVDERVELGARDRQLLAERVVGVEELAERGPVGAIERLLARGDEARGCFVTKQSPSWPPAKTIRVFRGVYPPPIFWWFGSPVGVACQT